MNLDFGLPGGNRKAVVLLSGGLDSAVALGVARAQGFECFAMTVEYGQRHAAEIGAAKRVASALGAKVHRSCIVNLNEFTESALTGNIPVPKDRSLREIGTGIPITYVPARNTVMLALAASWAESIGSNDVFIGVNAIDHSGYPDCRQEFIHAFEELLRVGTKTGSEAGMFRVHTPLITLRKAEIILLGVKLSVDFALTRTCYDPSPDDTSCGHCDACQLRLRGFAEAGLSDPIKYT